MRVQFLYLYIYMKEYKEESPSDGPFKLNVLLSIRITY